MTEEHKQKLSKAHKGIKLSKEHKKAISLSLLGHRTSWETRKKIGIAHKGKPSNMFGKKHSEETKRKISIAHTGKKQTLEHIEKNRQSQLKNPIRYWLGRKRPDMTGEKCHLWKGGKSFEPYGLEFNEDLKEVIRNRDRRKCQICEKTELDNSKKLSVHHIDYIKQNNNPDNLISLCINCHTKTNQKRDYWIKFWTTYNRAKYESTRK